jgi:hypothetical protein
MATSTSRESSISAAEPSINLVPTSSTARVGDAAKMDPAPYMLKRSQFKREREIRLLFVPDDPDVAIDRRPPLKLDWSRVVNQVVLDPRCVTGRPGRWSGS